MKWYKSSISFVPKIQEGCYMLSNKKILITLLFLLLMGTSLVFLSFKGDSFKVNDVQGVSLNVSDENLAVEISDLSDIKSISTILNKKAVNDSPSCPFGSVEIIIKFKSENIVVYPATDGCHIFRSMGKYFHVSDEEWAKLMHTFVKNGLDRSIFESKKDI